MAKRLKTGVEPILLPPLLSSRFSLLSLPFSYSMASVSAQEYQSVFSELQCLKEKFVSLEQENQRLLGDLQQLALEKQQTQQQHGELQQQHGELALRVQQLEAALQQQGSSPQGFHKEPKIGLPVKFDGIRSQFRGFLNQVRLVLQMHPSRYPTDASRVGLIGTFLSGSAFLGSHRFLKNNRPC